MEQDHYIDRLERASSNLKKSPEGEKIHLSEKKRKNFIYLYLSLVIISVGWLILNYKNSIAAETNISKNVLFIIAVLLFLIGFAFILLIYLSNFAHENPTDSHERNPEEINNLFYRHLSKNITEKHGFAKEYEDSLLKISGQKFDDLFGKSVIDEITSKYIQQFTFDLKYTRAFEDMYSLEAKIKNQINRLINNSNLHLIIGTLTTAIAIIVLYLSIYQKTTFNNLTDLLSYFIPRISTVIFIETFSFFFLRLYRKTLDEIKYFQNEISNLNFKISSLKSSIILDDKIAITTIINELSKTERNFILKKGETTEKIESEKNDISATEKLFSKFSNIINKAKN